jgi:hypothetical protein
VAASLPLLRIMVGPNTAPRSLDTDCMLLVMPVMVHPCGLGRKRIDN